MTSWNDGSYQAVLRRTGYLVAPVSGTSMLPMLHQSTDTVLLVPAGAGTLKPMDVALFRCGGQEQQTYVLHRILKVSDRQCLTMGDHNLNPETVATDRIIGKMASFFRNGNEIPLQSVRYRLYVLLWCRPWRTRARIMRLIFRTGGFLRRHEMLHRRKE